MSDQLDLETVRWKTVDELSPEERDFLTENKDKLNEEEQTAFSSFLNETAPEPVEEVAEEPVEETPQEETPQTEETVEEPKTEEPMLQFKTQAELDAYLQKQLEAREEAKRAEKERKIIEKQAREIVERKEWIAPGHKPKDWNEVLEIAATTIEEKAKAKQTLDAIKRDDLRKTLDKQYIELANEGKVPPLDSEEGKQMKETLTQFGIKHNQSTYQDAYELWSIVPEERGGGYKLDKDAIKKQKSKIQKKAASMVGGGGGEGSSSNKELDYKTLHESDLDELMEL